MNNNNNNDNKFYSNFNINNTYIYKYIQNLDALIYSLKLEGHWQEV